VIVIQLSTRGTVDSDIWSWRLVEKLLARSYHLFGRLWLNASKPETLLETTIMTFSASILGKATKIGLELCIFFLIFYGYYWSGQKKKNKCITTKRSANRKLSKDIPGKHSVNKERFNRFLVRRNNNIASCYMKAFRGPRRL